MVQLNLLLQYVAADSAAANLLPKWVWQAVRHWRDREQDIGWKRVCVCVCVC